MKARFALASCWPYFALSERRIPLEVAVGQGERERLSTLERTVSMHSTEGYVDLDRTVLPIRRELDSRGSTV